MCSVSCMWLVNTILLCLVVLFLICLWLPRLELFLKCSCFGQKLEACCSWKIFLIKKVYWLLNKKGCTALWLVMLLMHALKKNKNQTFRHEALNVLLGFWAEHLLCWLQKHFPWKWITEQIGTFWKSRCDMSCLFQVFISVILLF